MVKTAILLAKGFEEIEALTAVDLLRRASIVCDMIALDGADEVRGSHDITVRADRAFEGADWESYDALILPGGKKGTKRLAEDKRVKALLRRFAGEGKLVAAICAAPTVLAGAGLLEDRRAVCYPGLEAQMGGARMLAAPTAEDGPFVTGRAAGASIPFALAIVRHFLGEDGAAKLAEAIVYE